MTDDPNIVRVQLAELSGAALPAALLCYPSLSSGPDDLAWSTMIDLPGGEGKPLGACGATDLVGRPEGLENRVVMVQVQLGDPRAVVSNGSTSGPKRSWDYLG